MHVGEFVGVYRSHRIWSKNAYVYICYWFFFCCRIISKTCSVYCNIPSGVKSQKWMIWMSLEIMILLLCWTRTKYTFIRECITFCTKCIIRVTRRTNSPNSENGIGCLRIYFFRTPLNIKIIACWKTSKSQVLTISIFPQWWKPWAFFT